MSDGFAVDAMVVGAGNRGGTRGRRKEERVAERGKRRRFHGYHVALQGMAGRQERADLTAAADEFSMVLEACHCCIMLFITVLILDAKQMRLLSLPLPHTLSRDTVV